MKIEKKNIIFKIINSVIVLRIIISNLIQASIMLQLSMDLPKFTKSRIEFPPVWAAIRTHLSVLRASRLWHRPRAWSTQRDRMFSLWTWWTERAVDKGVGCHQSKHSLLILDQYCYSEQLTYVCMELLFPALNAVCCFYEV